MRSRSFEVPVDVMEEFAQIIDHNELSNEISGVANNGDIIVSVDYEPEQKKIVNEIHDLIDRFNDDREDEEEDEDDESEEDED